MELIIVILLIYGIYLANKWMDEWQIKKWTNKSKK